MGGQIDAPFRSSSGFSRNISTLRKQWIGQLLQSARRSFLGISKFLNYRATRNWAKTVLGMELTSNPTLLLLTDRGGCDRLPRCRDD